MTRKKIIIYSAITLIIVVLGVASMYFSSEIGASLFLSSTKRLSVRRNQEIKIKLNPKKTFKVEICQDTLKPIKKCSVLGSSVKAASKAFVVPGNFPTGKAVITIRERLTGGGLAGIPLNKYPVNVLLALSSSSGGSGGSGGGGSNGGSNGGSSNSGSGNPTPSPTSTPNPTPTATPSQTQFDLILNSVCVVPSEFSIQLEWKQGARGQVKFRKVGDSEWRDPPTIFGVSPYWDANGNVARTVEVFRPMSCPFEYLNMTANTDFEFFMYDANYSPVENGSHSSQTYRFNSGTTPDPKYGNLDPCVFRKLY